MITWMKDGLGFIYLEQHKVIFIDEIENVDAPTYYSIRADDVVIGDVDTIEEAKQVITRIAFAFKTAEAEVNPW